MEDRYENYMTNKETDHGRKYFDDKTVNYLKAKSREAIEENQNISLLYFQVDWENSKKNFYGELLFKKFINPQGIQLRGAIKMEQGGEQMQSGIPSKIMKLVFSCYVDALREMNCDPKRGDFFGYGKRLYEIYDKTLEDYGPGNVIGNRERMRIDFMSIEADDETLQRNPFGDNLGLDSQLRNNGLI